eukprot:GFUD01010035.1.p1 GENE.GFUD01010035.1~~GFUD01010035.1.p1  ORF type:complete len:158 (+),score=62.82 GFUD01010035.1:50-523(+)
MSGDFHEKNLKQVAVEEILKETSRAAARAEVGGSLSWTKPKHKGVNKRFLNNTLLSAVIQNTKSSLASTIPPKSGQATSQAPKVIPATVPSHSPVSLTTSQPKVTTKYKPASKMTISTSARYKACLASYKQQKLEGKLLISQTTSKTVRDTQTDTDS